jgi:hypothetical protein
LEKNKWKGEKDHNIDCSIKKIKNKVLDYWNNGKK